MKKNIVIVFLILINMGCGHSVIYEDVTNSESVVSNVTKSENKQIAKVNSNEINKDELMIDDTEIKKYIGCWAGSKGGRLKITQDKIYDKSSKEQTFYHESPNKKANQFKEKLEEHLLETKDEFKRSFLSNYIRIKFELDDLIYVFAYDTYEDYINHKYSGAGTFEKVSCEKAQWK